MFRTICIALAGASLLPAVALAGPAPAQPAATTLDQAAIFGEREDVQQISLSPGGTRIAFVAPGPGPSTVLYISDIAADAAPKIALSADGKPDRIRSCHWVSDNRLYCELYLVGISAGELLEATRIVAVDADGRNLKLLSRDRRADDARAVLGGGNVIDSLPDENGAVLMNREYVPQEAQATHMNDTRE